MFSLISVWLHAGMCTLFDIPPKNDSTKAAGLPKRLVLRAVEILDVVSKTIGRALPTHQLNMMDINNSNNAQTIRKGPARSQKAKNTPKKQKLFRNNANYLIDWLEAWPL